MRIMGLDIGQKRIGVAVTDEQCTIAYPLEVLENTIGVKEKLYSLIKKHCIGKIVVGMPYNLKGQEGHQAKIVREFVNLNLEESGTAVDYMDERYTSRISDSVLRAGKKQENKRGAMARNNRAGGEVDKISASIILSSYIEKQKQDSPK
ncbi:MAG: Holliday junction resolvase RuvX [Actinobacteria bacterium]|nr:Holliday junction resolvase RuvX [Actinomycetota bacterium]